MNKQKKRYFLFPLALAILMISLLLIPRFFPSETPAETGNPGAGSSGTGGPEVGSPEAGSPEAENNDSSLEPSQEMLSVPEFPFASSLVASMMIAVLFLKKRAK